MKPLKESISITLDSDLLKEIKIRAEQDQRSVSQYINLVLTEHIQKSETSTKL
ncbi:MAG: toxin-antitoxin system protein [Clostridia bacterium]|nr:toxin-antitoxin system protein [Clostridia bacterium]